MRWWLTSITLVLAGCDLVFPFVPPTTDAISDGPPTPGATCFPPAVTTTDPGLDSDGDSVVDVRDNCPTVPNTDQHDEDGDCRGDACDNCPHDAIDPDVPDADEDLVGVTCDPDDQVRHDVRFETFANGAPGWTGAGCTWLAAQDHYKHAEAGAERCVAILEISPTAQGSIRTRLVIEGQPGVFSAGLLYRISCDAQECNGAMVALARDLGGELWLRAGDLTGRTLTMSRQVQLAGELDSAPIDLEVVYGDSGAATAAVVFHGKRSELSGITSAKGSGVTGFVTLDTLASFQDYFGLQ